MNRLSLLVLCCAVIGAMSVLAADTPQPAAKKVNGNRLTYLDEPCNPYYVHKDFPKLTTPMWVGEEGVEAVVILGIDDMRGHEKWEAYLRPILNRLKQIDGRAPVSIMTNTIDPQQAHLQQWLSEGLSLECHTLDHPCPLLQGGARNEGRGASEQNKTPALDAPPSALSRAKLTYDLCVELMNRVPGNKPVAFRMPCCDSLNTVSPRFFTEIFNRTTASSDSFNGKPKATEQAQAKGQFLQIDSSVFNVFTSDDKSIPRELVLDAEGKERFVQYIPSNVPGRPERHANFVNTIENYPYPYVIDRLCWEFPCVTPSDWSAQFRQKPNNPKTVEDWKAALDITVLKQGVFCLVFHPHNWIKPEQVNELIDHSVNKHGKKVKFLTFKEALERLNKNVLGGQSLREAYRGEDNGVRLLDLENDSHLDVVIGNPSKQMTRHWTRDEKKWSETAFPSRFVEPIPASTTKPWFARPQILSADRDIACVSWHVEETPDGDLSPRFARWDSVGWQEFAKEDLPSALVVRIGCKTDCFTPSAVRWRDVTGDGFPDYLISGVRFLKDDKGDFTGMKSVLKVHAKNERREHIALPESIWPEEVPGPDVAAHREDITRTQVMDLGVRFLDLNADGHDDIVFSNRERYGVWLWESLEKGWSREVLSGRRGSKPAEQELPPIVRADGSNNGFWVHSRQLIWQNEDTANNPQLIETRSFDSLLAEYKQRAANAEPKTR